MGPVTAKPRERSVYPLRLSSPLSPAVQIAQRKTRVFTVSPYLLCGLPDSSLSQTVARTTCKQRITVGRCSGITSPPPTNTRHKQNTRGRARIYTHTDTITPTQNNKSAGKKTSKDHLQQTSMTRSSFKQELIYCGRRGGQTGTGLGDQMAVSVLLRLQERPGKETCTLSEALPPKLPGQMKCNQSPGSDTH